MSMQQITKGLTLKTKVSTPQKSQF